MSVVTIVNYSRHSKLLRCPYELLREKSGGCCADVAVSDPPESTDGDDVKLDEVDALYANFNVGLPLVVPADNGPLPSVAAFSAVANADLPGEAPRLDTPVDALIVELAVVTVDVVVADDAVAVVLPAAADCSFACLSWYSWKQGTMHRFVWHSGQ